MLDPTGPRSAWDCSNRRIRSCGHGDGSPSGHGVGSRSRRSRRGTAHSLPAKATFLAEPVQLLRYCGKQGGWRAGVQGGSKQRCMDLCCFPRGPRRSRDEERAHSLLAVAG